MNLSSSLPLTTDNHETLTKWLEDNKSTFFWSLFGYLCLTLFVAVYIEGWALVVALPFIHALIKGAIKNSAESLPFSQNSMTWMVVAYCAGMVNVALGAIVFCGHLLYLFSQKECLAAMEATLVQWVVTIKAKIN